MIGKSVVIFLTLFFAYNILLSEFPLKNASYYTIKERAEEFAFNPIYYDTVLVGSSLVQHIGTTPTFMGRNFINIFLHSNGSLTGIELIIKSGKIPKVLFIETNHLIFGTNNELLNSVFDYQIIKKILPSLLSKNKLTPFIFKKIKPNLSEERKLIFNRQFFDYAVYKNEKVFAEINDSLQYISCINELNSKMEYLESYGCQIYLIEMPIDKKLIRSERARYFRKTLRKILSKRKYLKIPLDLTRSYQTSDGIHLLDYESQIYEQYLDKYCSALQLNNMMRDK